VVVPGKPTVDTLGVDPDAQEWQRSGSGDGTIELAFVDALDERWVLMRVAGDHEGRILVYTTYEWECFLDGVRNGEFDAAAEDLR
jgi:hypothetical protein